MCNYYVRKQRHLKSTKWKEWKMKSQSNNRRMERKNSIKTEYKDYKKSGSSFQKGKDHDSDTQYNLQ